MKKIFVFATTAFLISGFAFAQSDKGKEKMKKESAKTCGKQCGKKKDEKKSN